MSQNYNDALSTTEFEKPVLTQTLNILTILTLVGSGILLLLSLATPWLTNFSKNMMAKAAESNKEMTAKQMEDMRKATEQIALTEKHMIPLMIVSIAGLVLCIIGAIMMRKLKKDGYWLYIAGQVIPFVGGLFIMGTAQYTNSGGAIFILAITILFVILYTMQRKNLVN